VSSCHGKGFFHFQKNEIKLVAYAINLWEISTYRLGDPEKMKTDENHLKECNRL